MNPSPYNTNNIHPEYIERVSKGTQVCVSTIDCKGCQLAFGQIKDGEHIAVIYNNNNKNVFKQPMKT